MPTQLPTRFTAYEFTQAELFSATRLSNLNVMLLQTLISQAAVRRTNLRYDPEKALEYVQQEAYIIAEIEAYEYLLSMMVDIQMPPDEEAQKKADVAKTPLQIQAAAISVPKTPL